MTEITKIPSQKNKKKQYKRGIDWLSEKCDLEVLYRIKGRSGLWMPITQPMNNGMLRMERFGEGDKCTVNKNKLSGLHGTAIRMEDQAVLPLPEAIDNIQKHCQNQTTDEYGIVGNDLALSIICPDYDPDSFKSHHGRKVVVWYNELIKGVRRASIDPDDKPKDKKDEKA